MSFIIGSLSPENTILHNLRPLRLSGQQGVIAQFVKEHAEAIAPNWTLKSQDLLLLAGENIAKDIFFCGFPLAAPPTPCIFYRLEEIHGSSQYFRSDLLFHFSPWTAEPQGDGTFRKISEEKDCHFCEALSLSGGTCGGLWQWTEAPLQMGAAIVGQ